MTTTLAAIKVRRSAVLATTVLLIAMYCFTALAAPAKAAGRRDSDHDGMPNRWERAHGLNPFKANANANPDHDGLVNVGEYTFGTDPLESDSDGDGIVDGDDDANDDGVADGNEDGNDDGDLAGTIASFDSTTGLLTLDTPGGQVTGTVTEGTELEWDGDCDGDSTATTADLAGGTGVNELEFVDGSSDLESVALACAGGDDQGDQ